LNPARNLSESVSEDWEMMYRADAMTTTCEFRADLLPVSDICKPEQPTADFDFMRKVIARFTQTVEFN